MFVFFILFYFLHTLRHFLRATRSIAVELYCATIAHTQHKYLAIY